MKKPINSTTIIGALYEHNLEMKKTGENSKNPGTDYIRGSISIATDDAQLNIVKVNFTYVTATTSKGTPNATYNNLKNIIDGVYKTVMQDGKDNASKFRINSAIGLNEFYSDRNGTEELISAKRNEGGFIHPVATIDDVPEKNRSEFDVDMIITKATRLEANEERNTPEKVVLKGCIFDFRKALLPVEFSVTNDKAMDYFESLEPSANSPVFTHIRGRQISETIVRRIEEESAFGEASVRETTTSHKDFVVTWAQTEPYAWDDESTITAAELKEAMAQREITLADLKQRNQDYKASRGNAAAASTPAAGAFNF